ncbi:hypothetical protein GpartN1_g6750.t1 [Galdieria partita]|uniref:Uncharacterized protein n=1 Tax=Galdieria partita TaxID=83374 RepID=A0A9C7Q350_9RHOD|nr:hypothetical protein GpartN1_g6750.t1 [Galdieria partita]
METKKQVSQVCKLDLLHRQRVSFSSVTWQGNEAQTEKDLKGSYLQWFRRASERRPKQNYLLAALYSSGHPFYFRAAFADLEEEEILVVTANLSSDPCCVVKKSKVLQSSSEVWKPEWLESKDLQVGLMCMLEEKGRHLILVDPCSVVLRVYSLESRKLYCCIQADNIHWKHGIVIAATVVYFGDTLSVLLLSDSLDIYCVSLASENSVKDTKFLTTRANLKMKHKRLLGARFSVNEENQIILALVFDKSVKLFNLVISPVVDNNVLSSFSISTENFLGDFCIPPGNLEIYNDSLKELWIAYSPKVMVARDIFQKVAYVWYWDKGSSWSKNVRSDSHSKPPLPKVTIENCECLINLEQHNICYLDSETHSFRWMNEDLVGLHVELGQGDVPVFSVVAAVATNSTSHFDMQSSLCQFAVVEVTALESNSHNEKLEYALEWRGWTLEKSTAENAFNMAVERRDYESALNISHFHKLNDDNYMIALWRISDGDADAARSLIQNITDPCLIVDECCQGFASSPAALKLLLRRAMEVIEDPQYAWKIENLDKKQQQLELWSSLLKLYQDEGLFDLLKMTEFFSYHIPSFLERIACLGLTDVIYRFLKTEPVLKFCCKENTSITDILWPIIGYIPEIIPPRTYYDLLVFMMECIKQSENESIRLFQLVRDRAFQIEERGGDFENVAQWLEIFNEEILCNLLVKEWHRLEELVNAVREEGAPKNVSFFTYCDQMDMEQQMLFILFHDTRPRETILQDLSEDCVEYFKQRIYGNTFRMFLKNRLEENSETKDILRNLLFRFLSYSVVRTGPLGINFIGIFLQFSVTLEETISDILHLESQISEDVLLERNGTNAQFALKVAYEGTCRDPPPIEEYDVSSLGNFSIVRLEDPRHWECDWDIEIIDSLGILFEALPTRVPSQVESQIRMFENHLIVLDYLWKYGGRFSLQFLFNITGDHPNLEALKLLKNSLKNIPLREIEEISISFQLDDTTLTQKMQSCYESLTDICHRLAFVDPEEPLHWICESLLVSECSVDVSFKFLILLSQEEQERLLSSHIMRKMQRQSIVEARKWISSWLQYTAQDPFSEFRATQTKYYRVLQNLCDVHDLLSDTFGFVPSDLLSLATDEQMKKSVLFQAADAICAQISKWKRQSLDYVEQQMVRLGSLLELPKELSQLALATACFKQGKMEWTIAILRVLVERQYEDCWELCNAIVASYLSIRVLPEGVTGNDLKMMAYFTCSHCPDEELVTWSEHLEEFIDREFPTQSRQTNNDHAKLSSNSSPNTSLSINLDATEFVNDIWSCIFYETEYHEVSYKSLEQVGPYDGRSVKSSLDMKTENSKLFNSCGRDSKENALISVCGEFLKSGLAGASTALSILSKVSSSTCSETWNAVVEQMLDASTKSSLKVGKGLVAFADCYRYLCFFKQDSSFHSQLEQYSIDDWCHLRFADVMNSCEELQRARNLWNEFVEEWDSYQVWKATFASSGEVEKVNSEEEADFPSKQQGKIAILKLCESTSLEDAEQIVSRAIKFGISECCCRTELLKSAFKRYCMKPDLSLEHSIFSFVEKYKDVLIRQEDELGWVQTFDSLLEQVSGDDYNTLQMLLKTGAILFSHAGQSSKESWCLKRKLELDILKDFFDNFVIHYKKKFNFKKLIETDSETCQREWLLFIEGLDYTISREYESKLLDDLCGLANQLGATLDFTPSSSWIKVMWVRYKLQCICEQSETPSIILEEELYEKVELLQTCELQDLVPFIRIGLRSLKVKPGISVRLDIVIGALQSISQRQMTTADQNSQRYHHWKQLQNERSTLETIARISEWLWLERTDLAEYLFEQFDREDMDYSLSKRVFVDLLKTFTAQFSVDSIYRGMKCLDNDWFTSTGTTPEELFTEVFSSAVVELLDECMLSFTHSEPLKGSTPWQIERCKHLLSTLSKSLMQQRQKSDRDPFMAYSPSTAWEESLLPSEEEEEDVFEQNILLYKQTLEKCLERVRSWVENLRQTVAESDLVHFNSLILELMELAIQLEQLHDLENKEIDSKQWKWWKLLNEMTEMLSSQESGSDSLLQRLSYLDRNIVENEVDASNAVAEELLPLCQTIHDCRVMNAFILTLDHVGNFTTKGQGHFRQVVIMWLEKLIQVYCQASDGPEDSSLIVPMVEHFGNFAKMGWEEKHIERLLASLFEKRPLLASILGVVSGYPSLSHFYISHLERLAPYESVDLSILPLVKKWVLEDTLNRLTVVGRSWLFAALVPSLLQQETQETLDNILGNLVDAGLVEQAGLLCMEKEAIHPAFRNRYSGIAFMKRYWITRLKEISTSHHTSSDRRKNLLTRLKYLEKYSYE